jgi:hypothetical protein
MNLFFRTFVAEWRKTRRTLAAWLIVIGAFFTPAVIIAARLLHHDRLAALYAAPNFWYSLWQSSWESMAIFLLPLGTILVTSLVVQIEVRNNAWKQLHALPVPMSVLFSAKLAVIVVMMVQFFALFNVGIALAGLVPWLLVPGVPFPAGPVPLEAFLWHDLLYMIDLLPILALQYLLSLQYKNFIVALGGGVLLWIAALSALRWEYGYTIPYTYIIVGYLQSAASAKGPSWPVNIHLLAGVYASAFFSLGAVLYLTKKDRC